VQHEEILVGAVRSEEIATDAVGSDELDDLAVGTADLAFAAATTDKLEQFPAARVNRTTDQSITNSVNDLVTWDVAAFDIQGLFNPGQASRLTAERDGLYEVTFNAYFDSAAAGRRDAFIKRNAGGSCVTTSNLLAMDSTATGSTPLSVDVSTLIDLNDGDYVEFCVFQNSGADLDLRTFATQASMRWVGNG
jgi:hypothetical protein